MFYKARSTQDKNRLVQDGSDVRFRSLPPDGLGPPQEIPSVPRTDVVLGIVVTKEDLLVRGRKDTKSRKWFSAFQGFEEGECAIFKIFYL